MHPAGTSTVLLLEAWALLFAGFSATTQQAGRCPPPTPSLVRDHPSLLGASRQGQDLDFVPQDSTSRGLGALARSLSLYTLIRRRRNGAPVMMELLSFPDKRSLSPRARALSLQIPHRLPGMYVCDWRVTRPGRQFDSGGPGSLYGIRWIRITPPPPPPGRGKISKSAPGW